MDDWSAIVEGMADKVLSLRRKEVMRKDIQPNIVVYAGTKQFYALRSICNSASYTMRDNIFLGAKVVEVCERSYLHVALGEKQKTLTSAAKGF